MISFLKAIGLSVALTAASAASLATDATPPRSPDYAIDVQATVAQDPLGAVTFGDFEARFEETTLDQIHDRFAAGFVEHRGDAGDSLYWLCYSSTTEIIWLVSHGEIGGPDHRLTEVIAEEVEASDPRKGSCPSISSSLWPPRLAFGWIGTTKAAIEEVLGLPSGVRGDWLQYLYQGKLSGRYQGPGENEAHTVEFDVTAYIELHVRGGRVVAIAASHATSS